MSPGGVETGPNVFVVGVAKCGTTSFVRYLSQHPDIFLPECKEPNYFVASTTGLNTRGPASANRISHQLHRFSVTDLASYRALYEGGRDCSVRIDGSVRYLYHPAALEAAVGRYPEAKFIVILRDPAERMISHWRMNRQQHLEPLGLADALASEDDRYRASWGFDWHYRRVSDYRQQLEHLEALVPIENTHLMFYGDFARSQQQSLSSACRFLGVSDNFRFDVSERGMVPVDYRWPLVDRALATSNPIRSAIAKIPVVGQSTLAAAIRLNHRLPRPISEDDAVALAPMRERIVRDLALRLTLDAEEVGSRLAGRLGALT